MSLSTWFKDYLYIPLGGNRVTFVRLCFNLFLVFIISGFWHGASWTFIIWGALHGIYTVAEIIIRKYGSKNEINNPKVNFIVIGLKRILVFYLVCFAWIFFRAENVTKAIFIAKQYLIAIPTYIFNLSQKGYLWLEPLIFKRDIHLNLIDFLLLGCALSILFFINKIEYKTKFINFLDNKSVFLKWGFYQLILLFFFLFAAFHSEQEFIYFQF